jgi:ABC-type glycerol-3-phosphate transport system substrate-binding protein
LHDAGEDQVVNIGITYAVHLTTTSKNPEAAKKFLSYFVSKEAGTIYSVKGKMLSAVKGVDEPFDPAMKLYLPWLDHDKKSPHADLVWVPGIKDVMKEVTQKWFMGEDLDKVLDEWEMKHQRLLSANPKFKEEFLREQ